MLLFQFFRMIKFHESFQREIKYLHHGATIHPYIAFVGCFKTFFVFNCNYPKECYDSWLIVQQLLFQLHTPHDKSTSMTKRYRGSFNNFIFLYLVFNTFSLNHNYLID